MPYVSDSTSPYYIDNRGRVRALQKKMEERGLGVYIGSRPRTLSWILDAFSPWRTYVAIPPKGDPVAFTFW